MKNTLLLILTLVFCTYAEQLVGGILTRNTRWNADEGPFILQRDLLIPEGLKLTIAPGTRLIIAPVPINDTSHQIDRIDSGTISIKVNGLFTCIGRRDKRITISPQEFNTDRPLWYGIVFIRAESEFAEIAYTDITGAYCGITTKNSSPLIRTTILEYNHIGISFTDGGFARVFNCVIARNFASGILVNRSNPHIANSIIAFNNNTGVLGDGVSKIKFEYNCISGNSDGDFLDCDPELGIFVKINKNRDSVDYAHNILKDPIFSGSLSDSMATEKDISLPTKMSRVKDTTIAEIINGENATESLKKSSSITKYSLSEYSPCINAGNPAQQFRDLDGSKNDIGISGGPEFFSEK